MGQQISSWALWHGAALKIIFEASEPDFFHFEGQQSSKCQIPMLGFFYISCCHFSHLPRGVQRTNWTLWSKADLTF